MAPRHMKTVVILANHDFASLFALNHLLPRLSQQLPSGIRYRLLLSDGVGKLQKHSVSLTSLAEFEQSLLLPWSHNSPIESAYRQASFAQLDTEYQLQRRFVNLSDSRDADSIISLKPSLVLSIRFGQILKSPLISALACPIFNLHSGLLPTYRGVMATFWSMYNLDKGYGCSVHSISDGSIDTGALHNEIQLTDSPYKSYLARVLALYPVGVKLLADVAVTSIMGNAVVVLASNTERREQYYTYPSQQQLEEFFRKGFCLFDESELNHVLSYSAWGN